MMDKQPKENPARMHAKLVEVTEFSDEVMAHVQRLLAQYTPNRSPFLKYTLCTILNSTSSHLFFLRPEHANAQDQAEEKQVLGMVTVNICQTCSSPRAWVDDFVVDEKYRRHGLAHTMMDQVRADIADQPEAEDTVSITTPNGTVIREGDIVTLTDSKIEREVVAITDGTTITARRIDAGTRQVEVTTDKLNGVKVISA